MLSHAVVFSEYCMLMSPCYPSDALPWMIACSHTTLLEGRGLFGSYIAAVDKGPAGAGAAAAQVSMRASHYVIPVNT